MRDEKEERKKQARSNKQTNKATCTHDMFAWLCVHAGIDYCVYTYTHITVCVLCVCVLCVCVLCVCACLQVLYIADVVNRPEYIPRNPTFDNLPNVFDVRFPEVYNMIIGVK